MHLKSGSIAFLLFAFAVVLITGCCKEPINPPIPPPPLPDPCAGKKPVTADFKIKEVLGQGVFLSSFQTETDNILANKNVLFEAEEEGAEYTWYIGNEVLHTRSVGRHFGQQWIGQTIAVTLVVEKEPNLACFPNDPGKDSLTKYMKVVDWCDYNNMPMNGTFRIAREMQTDSFDFTIELFNHPIFTYLSCQELNLYNVDGMGNDCVSGTNMNIYRVERNHRFLKKSGGADQCFGFDMQAQLHLNNEFELLFKHYANIFPDYETRRFFGRKIN